MESTARLFASPSISRQGNTAKQTALAELVTALDSVIHARGKRYLMANVPRATLDRVKEILPGLNGPTIIDILDGGIYVAVHAVVPMDSVYRTIGSLKLLGAEGILVFHAFTKKTQTTPPSEILIAKKRLKEMRDE